MLGYSDKSGINTNPILPRFLKLGSKKKPQHDVFCLWKVPGLPLIACDYVMWDFIFPETNWSKSEIAMEELKLGGKMMLVGVSLRLDS